MAGAGVLDLQGRAQADRRPGDRGRDRAHVSRSALHRHSDLLHPAAGRVSCGGPREGTGDEGDGAGTPHAAGLPLVWGGNPARLSGLSKLQAASADGLSVLRPRARAGLEALSLLRSRSQGTADPPPVDGPAGLVEAQ